MTAPSDGGWARMPTLRREGGDRGDSVIANEEKADLFHKAFFYEAPEVETTLDGEGAVEPAFEWSPITDKEIYAAIAKLKPHKAPGLSGIPNIVLMKTKYMIVPYLGPIFRATFDVRAYPERWKIFKTVVVKKPGKDDYSNPNSYRPIALLDTVAKVLSSCIKTKLAYWVEKKNLLPKYQFGGRPGRSTTDSLHTLITFIKDAWRRGKEVVVLFIDVKGAFLNTVPQILARDMRRKGIPEEVVTWFERKLDGRRTVVAFDDFTSRDIPVESGLDQGCNTSGICYNFYNAGQIEGAREKDRELAGSFADDAYVAAEGDSMEEVARKVEDMMKRKGGASEWAETHHSIYEIKKFVAMGFMRRRERDGRRQGRMKPATRPRVTVNGTRIRVETAHKFLGVILDQELRFREHAAYAHGKGTTVAMQARRLARTNGGVKGAFMRRMYEAVVVPSMLYAADVWCTPDVETEGKTTKGSQSFMAKLGRVQRTSALQITGALRTTPTDLLEAHAGLMPIPTRIKKACVLAAACIALMPQTHPLYKPARRAAKFVKRHRAPLHHIMKAMGRHPNDMETIAIVWHPPDWRCPFKITIDGTVEEAEERERHNEAEIRIYSDGSGHKGRIGAAAVLYRRFRREVRVLRKCLGSDKDHTVFEGECVGQLLGLELLRREARGRGRIRDATLGTDNQAGMKAVGDTGRGTARYLVDEILDGFRRVENINAHLGFELYWTPGHAGIPGNERADKEAKRAAEGDETETRGVAVLRKPLKTSKAAILAAHKKRWQGEMEQQLRDSPHFGRLQSVDRNAPQMKMAVRMADALPRRHAALLIQLCTGHCPLNQYLHRFGRRESPLCGACQEAPETVEHFLIECRAHDRHRGEMRRAL